MNEVLVYERRETAAWLTLNRPTELNSLSPELLRAFDSALDRAKADASVRAVVVTGAGRAFCTGADLKFLDAMPPDQRAARTAGFLAEATTAISKLSNFPKPVIGGINGVTMAGGLELLLACDIVVAARGAKIGDGHANFGLLPGAGGSVRLPRRIGLARAKYLLFTGELFPAESLVTTGLVNEVVEPAELNDRLSKIASILAAKSPLGLSRMKSMLNQSLDATEAEGLAFEQSVGAIHTTSYDYSEGLAAFKERRNPRFEGR